jgi:hypothetical protein
MLGLATKDFQLHWRIQIIYVACLVLATGLCVRSFHQVCETVLAALYIGSSPRTDPEHAHEPSIHAV